MFAAVDAYDRYVGRYTPALAREMVAAANVAAGQRVLDVGCGPGALTRVLADVTGARNVAAVDPSESFVEACRARNPGVDVRVATAESLPFDDGTFDAAIAQLVVNFMTDADEGVGEMGRVTRAGGVVAAAVWDYGDGMTMIRRFWDSAAAVDPENAPRDERNMRFATPGELRTLWERVGLESIKTGAAVVSAAYEGFEDLWQPFERGVGPAGAYASSLAPDARGRLKDELRRQLGAGDGPFELDARAWVVSGTVPVAR